jgi:hypothetical protein
MNCKFGAIIVDAKGKIGGHVISHNKYGAFMSTKNMGKSNASESQGKTRSMFSTVLKSYRNLTSQQMIAWNAITPLFARANYFGENKIPAATALYARLNLTLLSIGEDMITDPPAFASPGELATISLVATSAPALTLTYTEAIPASVKAVVFATPPISKGRMATEMLYKKIGVLKTGVPDQSPKSLATEYASVFGALPAVGLKVHVAVQLVDTSSGISGLFRSAAAIVTAV